MKLRIIWGVLACTLILGCFAACNDTPDPVETAPTTPTTTPTTAVIIDDDLAAMLTAEEITDAVGVEMSKPTVSEQGSVLTSVGIEEKVTLSVEVSEKPREIFDQVLLSYPMMEPCPNLGENAWYTSIYHQLLVYDNEHMITVELIDLNDEGDKEMLRCRQIAAELLEHLHANESAE